VNARIVIGTIEPGNRAMRDDGTDGRINAAEHTLGLAECVGEEDARALLGLIFQPPCVDIFEDRELIAPTIYRKPKGAFGDKDVTSNRLKAFARTVSDGLVVAADDPDFTGRG